MSDLALVFSEHLGTNFIYYENKISIIWDADFTPDHTSHELRKR